MGVAIVLYWFSSWSSWSADMVVLVIVVGEISVEINGHCG